MCICTNMPKISQFYQFTLEIKSILEPKDQIGHTHFPPWPTKFFLINFCEFVSTCKKAGYFIDCFWWYDWLKNPAIWMLSRIWPISQEQKLSQIWNLCRNTANIINFPYRTKSVKINDHIFNKLKKPCFCSIFSIFGLKHLFSEKSGCHTLLHMDF